VSELHYFPLRRFVFCDLFEQGIFSGTSQTLLVCVSPARSSCTFVTTASKGYMNSVLLGVSAVCYKSYLQIVENIFSISFDFSRLVIFATNLSVTFKVDHLDVWVILKLMTWAISILYRLRLRRYELA
jgi:hypothetical protein